MREFDHSKIGALQKIRDIRNLFYQIKQDYKDLCEKWAVLQKGKIEISENVKISEQLAWIKVAIQQLKIQNDDSVEGIFWGGIREIENDVQNIEEKLKVKTMGFISNEKILTYGEK